MLSLHDDPQTSADYSLSVIEEELERLQSVPADLSPFRDRMADIAARLRDQAINAPRKGDAR